MLKYVDTELLNSGGSRAVEDFMCQPEARHLLVLQVSVATGSRGGTRPHRVAAGGRLGYRRAVRCTADGGSGRAPGLRRRRRGKLTY